MGKFSYILVLKDAGRYDIAEMFNYRYLSQFLWNLGNEVFAVSVGTLVLIASKFIMSTEPMKRILKAVSFFIIAIGFYFMGWIFFDPLFAGPTEIIMAVIYSIVCTALFFPFMMYLNREVTSIKELKASFIDFLVSLKPDYKKMTKHALKSNLYQEAEQEVFDEIKTDSDKFQQKLYGKAEELID